MFYSLSHEFRNPLNHIKGAFFLAIENLGEPRQAKEHLEMGNSSQERLLLKVSDFSDYVEIEQGTFKLQKEPESVRHILVELEEMFKYSTTPQ